MASSHPRRTSRRQLRSRTGRFLVLTLAMCAAACDGGGDGAPEATASPTAPSQATPATPAPAPGSPTTTAGSYYVDPAGSDQADGRTPATAFQSITRALAVVTAGEVVRIRPGTYVESMRVTLHGQPGRPITIAGDGGRPVISGGRRLRTGIWLEESAHVTVENVEFSDFTDVGLMAVSSRDIRARNLVVHDNGFRSTIAWVEGYGLHMDESSGVTIEGNDVYRNGPNPRTPIDVGTGIDCFAIRDSVIRNNRSHDNIGGGILVEDSTNVLVEGNDIFANDLDVSADQWWDGGIWLDGGSRVTIRNNRFHDNLGPGIEVSDEDRQSPTGYIIENNVSTGNYFGIFIWNFGTTGLPSPAILRLQGNTFTGNSRRDVWIEPWQ